MEKNITEEVKSTLSNSMAQLYARLSIRCHDCRRFIVDAEKSIEYGLEQIEKYKIKMKEVRAEAEKMGMDMGHFDIIDK